MSVIQNKQQRNTCRWSDGRLAGSPPIRIKYAAEVSRILMATQGVHDCYNLAGTFREAKERKRLRSNTQKSRLSRSEKRGV